MVAPWRGRCNQSLLALAALILGGVLVATFGHSMVQQWLSSRELLPVGGQVVLPPIAYAQGPGCDAELSGRGEGAPPARVGREGARV
jgi:hypothetical protein